jgi:3-phenylpropionate/trans-cinnamate dioxygenase ferredoxin subunit
VVTIRLRRNGPYVIESDETRVIDWEGVEYQIDRHPIALCRCGSSARKPFCDGTHAKIGFDGGREAGRSTDSLTPDTESVSSARVGEGTRDPGSETGD